MGQSEEEGRHSAAIFCDASGKRKGEGKKKEEGED